MPTVISQQQKRNNALNRVTLHRIVLADRLLLRFPYFLRDLPVTKLLSRTTLHRVVPAHRLLPRIRFLLKVSYDLRRLLEKELLDRATLRQVVPAHRFLLKVPHCLPIRSHTRRQRQPPKKAKTVIYNRKSIPRKELLAKATLHQVVPALRLLLKVPHHLRNLLRL